MKNWSDSKCDSTTKAFIAAFCLFFLVVSPGCSTPEICLHSPPKRTSNLVKVDGNSPIIVVALDTAPNVGSSLFQSTLDYLGYDYYLLGNTKEKPEPVKNGLFRLALWHYRFNRYYDAVSQIAAATPDKLVLLSDASDVLMTRPAKKVAEEFGKLGKDIVLSGTIYCCNVNPLAYVRTAAKTLHIDDIESSDPKTSHQVKCLTSTVMFSGGQHGGRDLPGMLWMSQTQKILEGIRKIPFEPLGPATKFRHINAGGIIGPASKLKQAMSEIPMEPYGDDEELWHDWYTNIGYPSGRATIDYKQHIFAVVSEEPNIPAETPILFGDAPSLPERIFFNLKPDPKAIGFRNVFGNMPSALHCAGCNGNQMSYFRKRVRDLFPNPEKIFKQPDLEFVESCG
jgi:hypothetical protein